MDADGVAYELHTVPVRSFDSDAEDRAEIKLGLNEPDDVPRPAPNGAKGLEGDWPNEWSGDDESEK